MLDILITIFKLFLGVGFLHTFKDIIGSLIALLSGILVTILTLFPNLKSIYNTISKGHFNILKNQIETIKEKLVLWQ